MKYAILLAAFTFISQSIHAKEPSINDLLRRIEILEQKMAVWVAIEAASAVEVPVAAQQENSKRGEIIVRVLKDGSVQVNEKTMTDAQLTDGLKAVAAHFPDQAVRILGDKQAPYQSIVRIVDLCQKSGVWNISFATAESDDEPDTGE